MLNTPTSMLSRGVKSTGLVLVPTQEMLVTACHTMMDVTSLHLIRTMIPGVVTVLPHIMVHGGMLAATTLSSLVIIIQCNIYAYIVINKLN